MRQPKPEESGLWALVVTFGIVIILLCWAEPEPVVCPSSPAVAPPSDRGSTPPVKFDSYKTRERRRYTMVA